MLRKNKVAKYGFEFMFYADFVEVYGLNSYETSVEAMEEITQFASCEFAVRQFIIKYPQKMLTQLLQWSKHKNEHIRRLASEGSRPRLPWAIALPDFKNNPKPILPILENLKNDESLYVRRSVANNLNDIAKDNPDVVINIAHKWHGNNEETNWLVKHACRTLLKQGNTQLMLLFGFGSVEDIAVEEFKIITPSVKIGDVLSFSFQLKNNAKTPLKIRLEYAIYYLKANGLLSKKVFKISEKQYSQNSTSLITKKQSFKVISTRKFYEGMHQVSVIVNGKEFEKLDFQLCE
ncbi:UNVERIFIED_CONTAM: hypothetical protein GTU68_010346 [Idotea baltica]|nr:hypothetical protein [Idotea baltica]